MNKKVLVSVLGILGIIIVTAGVTYAFFSYSRTGTKVNKISSGAITFLYTEVDGIGNGLGIEDAMPMTDVQGKAQNNYFQFKVTSKKNNTFKMPYTVTARQSNSSDDIGSIVKVYLTDENNNEIEAPRIYSSLNQYENANIDLSNYTEKVIYQGKVPVNSTNYEKNFRLRMWIDENADYATNDYNNKTFTLTVNVYAEGSVATESDREQERDTRLGILKVNNQELTKVTGEDYDYEVKLPEGTTVATLVAQAVSSDATVTVTETNSNYAYIGEVKNTKIRKISTGIEKELNVGDTRYKYYKVTVTPLVGNPANYKLRVKVLHTYTSVGDIENSFTSAEKKAVIVCGRNSNGYTDCDTYSSLQTAVNAKNNSYVFPTQNITIGTSGSTIEIVSSKTVTIDLNGKTLSLNGNYTYNGRTGSNGIAVFGNLTLLDSRTGGTLTSSGQTIANAGNLSINSGRYISTGTHVLSNQLSGYAYIRGGTFSASGQWLIWNNANASLTITNGEFNFTGSNNDYGVFVNDSSANINISGGTFNSTRRITYTGASATGQVSISGGTFTTTQTSGWPILENASDNAKLTISGGTYTSSSTGMLIQTYKSGVITISGGTFNATNADSVLWNHSNGTINVCGGKYNGKTLIAGNNSTSGIYNYTSSFTYTQTTSGSVASSKGTFNQVNIFTCIAS